MKRKLTLLSFSFVLAGALALLLGSQPAQAQRLTAVTGGNPGISHIASGPDRSFLELDPDDYQPMPLPTPPETSDSSGRIKPGDPSEFYAGNYQPMPLPTPKQPPRPPRKPEEPVDKVTGTPKTRGTAGAGQLAVQR